MKERMIIWIISFLSFAGILGCGGPEDPINEDAWKIIWANESGNDPADGGGLGIKNTGWYNLFDEQVGYKIKYNYTPSAPPSSSTLSLETAPKFYSSVYNYVKSFYEAQNINPGDIDASKVSLLFGIQDIAGRTSTTRGVTSPRGRISQDVAVSFILTSIILSTSTSPEKGWKRVDRTVFHELGHARGLNALDDNTDYLDHYTHGGIGMTTCVMNNLVEDPPPFTFCDYHRKILKNCLSSIQQTYSPAADCAMN